MRVHAADAQPISIFMVCSDLCQRNTNQPRQRPFGAALLRLISSHQKKILCLQIDLNFTLHARCLRRKKERNARGQDCLLLLSKFAPEKLISQTCAHAREHECEGEANARPGHIPRPLVLPRSMCLRHHITRQRASITQDRRPFSSVPQLFPSVSPNTSPVFFGASPVSFGTSSVSLSFLPYLTRVPQYLTRFLRFFTRQFPLSPHPCTSARRPFP